MGHAPARKNVGKQPKSFGAITLSQAAPPASAEFRLLHGGENPKNAS